MYRRRQRRSHKGILIMGVLLTTALAASFLGWLPGVRLASAKLPNEASSPSATVSPQATQVPATAAEAVSHVTVTPIASVVADAPADRVSANPTPAGLVNYIVVEGDTLTDLAKHFKTTVALLLADNPGLDAAHLTADRLIKVPDLTPPDTPRPSFTWPADGPITTPFGVPGSDWIGGYHMGLDIGADTGDVVWSAGEGVIVDTGTNGRNHGYGTYILVYHYDGWWTLYAHLSKVYRDIGYPVRKGEPIGEVGMTGFANGPHLHFEVWHGEEKVDPIQFLP